jgi:hypothetical protein
MSNRQIVLWGVVGAVVGIGVGAVNDNFPLWVAIGIAMGVAMGLLQARFDPEH